MLSCHGRPKKFSKFSKLSSMLKMNKDHRSAGLRWSLLLSGGSLGGHSSFLGLICSCFIFSITSPITAGVAADVFVKCLLHLMVNEKNQPPYAIMMPGDPCFTLEKCSLECLECRTKKGGKRASHGML